MSELGLTGTLIGYDPGGDGTHGVAALRVAKGRVTGAEHETLRTTEEVLRWIEGAGPITSIGVDTICYWSTGSAGWRPADRWLKQHYPDVQKSIAPPNGLFGSMGLNGMAVLHHLRGEMPELPVTEAHPKVLYRALAG